MTYDRHVALPRDHSERRQGEVAVGVVRSPSAARRTRGRVLHVGGVDGGSLLEDLVGVAAVPLPPVLVELWRSPAREDVVGDVVVDIHEAGEDGGWSWASLERRSRASPARHRVA